MEKVSRRDRQTDRQTSKQTNPHTLIVSKDVFIVSFIRLQNANKRKGITHYEEKQCMLTASKEAQTKQKVNSFRSNLPNLHGPTPSLRLNFPPTLPVKKTHTKNNSAGLTDDGSLSSFQWRFVQRFRLPHLPPGEAIAV